MLDFAIVIVLPDVAIVADVVLAQRLILENILKLLYHVHNLGHEGQVELTCDDFMIMFLD